MHLLVVYVIIVGGGEIIAYGLGLVIEQAVPSFSMLLYMALFFGVLWGGWPLAVYLSARWEHLLGRSFQSGKV